MIGLVSAVPFEQDAAAQRPQRLLELRPVCHRHRRECGSQRLLASPGASGELKDKDVDSTIYEYIWDIYACIYRIFMSIIWSIYIYRIYMSIFIGYMIYVYMYV